MGFDYSEHLAAVMSADDLTGAIAAIDAHTISTKKNKALVLSTGGFARSGEFQSMPLDEVGPRYRHAVHEAIQPAIDHADVVVEVGCGCGDMLAYLATQNPTKRFIGTDVEPTAIKCVDALARFSANISSAAFDMTAPDLSFLARYKRPLFISFGTLCLFPAGHFLDAMAAAAAALCAFEPISYQLPRRYLAKPPLTTEEFSRAMGLNTTLWDEIEKRPNLRIETVIPDLTARSPVYPMSLVQVQALAGS